MSPDMDTSTITLNRRLAHFGEPPEVNKGMENSDKKASFFLASDGECEMDGATTIIHSEPSEDCCQALPEVSTSSNNALKAKLANLSEKALSPIPECSSQGPSRQGSSDDRTFRWTLDFPQPVSDTAKLQHSLSTSKIALEEVEINQAESKMAGTIRVLNLGVEKKVFVRATYDRWLTHMDYPATYLSSLQPFTDSFVFEIPLPTAIAGCRVEFSCGYFPSRPTGGGEYWDSNGGDNYGISADPTSLRKGDLAEHQATCSSIPSDEDFGEVKTSQWSGTNRR